MDYYTAIITIQIFAAIVMIFMISSNPIISNRMKRDFVTEFALLALISTTEWLNIRMNGAPENLRVLHYAVKAIEFISIPVMLAMGVMMFEVFKKGRILIIAVVLQGILELISPFFGWIFYMDENNCYVRGPYYFVYVAFYVIEVFVIMAELILAGKRFQNSNLMMLLLGASFIFYGIAIQLTDSAVRTAFLTSEMALTMSYIYVNNLILQTDRITGLLNRWSYEKNVESINYETCLMIFDVDSFKSINDSFGHQVGDECLRITGDLLKRNFSKEGKVYRIGGDEFCVIMKKRSKYAKAGYEERIKALISRFEIEVDTIRKNDPRFTGISVGYAYTEPGFSVQWAVETADKVMYENKNARK